MDNIQDNLIDDFIINEDAKSHLNEVSKWANISAIAGFIALGVSLVSTFSSLSKVAGTRGASGSIIMGALITATISLLLNITLLQAATNLKKGLVMTDQNFFGVGLSKLATYFKIIGVILIVILSLIILALLFGGLIGMFR